MTNFWEHHFREEAADLISLRYFKPGFMSLKATHPIFTSAGPSRYFVTMAGVQAVMLSGRYRTEALASHWSDSGTRDCKTEHCKGQNLEENIEHILSKCYSLDQTRTQLRHFKSNYSSKVDNAEIRRLIYTYTNTDHPQFCQFLVDCSVLPDVIRACQDYGQGVVHSHLFRVTRSWCYSLHRDRLKLLGRWRGCRR